MTVAAGSSPSPPPQGVPTGDDGPTIAAQAEARQLVGEGVQVRVGHGGGCPAGGPAGNQ